MIFKTILIPATLLFIAAYVLFSFFCDFYYIGSITYVGNESRTEAGLAVGLASKSAGLYVCRPADTLAGQTAKLASVRFSCPNILSIGQAGLLAGRTGGSADRQTVQNIDKIIRIDFFQLNDLRILIYMKY